MAIMFAVMIDCTVIFVSVIKGERLESAIFVIIRAGFARRARGIERPKRLLQIYILSECEYVCVCMCG